MESVTRKEPRGVRAGHGVDKEDAPDVVEEEVKRPEYEEALDAQGQSQWSDTPSIMDQYANHPGLCRKGPPKVAVFVVTDASGLKACNDLLARSEPRGAPGVVFTEFSKEHHEGTWTVFAKYQEIKYKKLIKTGTKP